MRITRILGAFVLVSAFLTVSVEAGDCNSFTPAAPTVKNNYGPMSKCASRYQNFGFINITKLIQENPNFTVSVLQQCKSYPATDKIFSTSGAQSIKSFYSNICNAFSDVIKWASGETSTFPNLSVYKIDTGVHFGIEAGTTASAFKSTISKNWSAIYNASL